MSMTELGERWVQQHSLSEGFDMVHAQSRRAAEFWIRAFVNEVEKRAAEQHPGYPDGIAYGIIGAFTALTRELLGDER